MLQRLLSQLVLPILIIAIGAGGLVWLSAKDAPPQRVAKEPPPLLVETISLQPSSSTFPIHVSGNVVPRREVTLSAEVDGAVIVKGESIESGRHVRQGTPLLQIDPVRHQVQADKLRSELLQVAADLRQLDTEEQGVGTLIELAKREAEIATAASKRLQSLVLKNAVTDVEREAVERTELQARNLLRALQNKQELIPIRRERLQAQRKLTELSQMEAQLNLDRTKIIAPFSGMIAAVMVEKGNYVQAGDVLLKLDDTTAVDVECSLRMDDLYWLWSSHAATNGVNRANSNLLPESATGQSLNLSDVSVSNDEGPAEEATTGELFEIPAAPAKVTGEVAGHRFHWNGHLARYDGDGVDRKTRTVPCRVRVDEPVRTDIVDGPPALMRGMYVTVTLMAKPNIRLWHIPSRAVQPNGLVWTVDNGVLRMHTVQPAKALPDGVLVRADSTDLKPGDRLVTTQLVTPMDGSRVREHVADAKDSQFSAKGDGP